MCVIHSHVAYKPFPFSTFSGMAASVRLIVRHDTEGEWVLAGATSPAHGRTVAVPRRCGSPVRDNWTFLSESPVEMSYKAALSATPSTTAPCSPDFTAAASATPGSSSAGGRFPVGRRGKASPVVVKQPEIGGNSDSSDDAGCCSTYQVRKNRAGGCGNNKSRNNRKK